MKLREQKEKHTWAVQIMNELINNTHIYEYDDSGGNPGVLPTANELDETMPYKLGEDGSDDIKGPIDLWMEDEPFPQRTDQENLDYESNQNGNGNQINLDKNKQGVYIYPLPPSVNQLTNSIRIYI